METTEPTDLHALAATLVRPEEEPEAEVDETEAPEEDLEAEAVEAEAEEDPDSDSDDAAVEPEEAPDLIAVKVNGKEVRVTLEDLKKSYSAEAYRQEGMREAAEARKQAEATARAVQEQREALLQFAQQIQQTGVHPRPVPPSQEMADKDPIGYLRADAKYRAEMSDYLAQQQQMQTFSRQAQEHRAREEMALREAEAKKLVESIPEFADPKKAPAIRDNLLRAAEHYGYSSQEIEGVMDSRALRILHDAAQWQALQSGKAVAAQKVANAKPVLKPGTKAPAQPNAQRLRERLKQTGRIEDALSLILKG